MTEQNRAYADLTKELRAAAAAVRSQPVSVGIISTLGSVFVSADDARWIADQLDRLRVLCEPEHAPVGPGFGTPWRAAVDSHCWICKGVDKHESACAWLLAKQAFEAER